MRDSVVCKGCDKGEGDRFVLRGAGVRFGMLQKIVW